MSGGLEQIRALLCGYLAEHGVNAVLAWEGGERQRPEQAVTVVSLRSCQAGPAGFRDYLGERFNETTGLWEELYGRKAQLTFGLDLYAPAGSSEGELQREFQKVVQTLTLGSPEGLEVQEISCEKTEYDEAARLLKQSARAVCGAYLYAAEQEEGEFLDFELRGGLNG